MKQKLPDCADWMYDKEINRVSLSSEIIQSALHVKQLLGIVEEGYHAKGVGQNDLLIVAAAKAERVQLVSEEGRQPIRPNEMSKYKIPAVCSLPQVDVPCIQFIELIKSSNTIFC